MRQTLPVEKLSGRICRLGFENVTDGDAETNFCPLASTNYSFSLGRHGCGDGIQSVFSIGSVSIEDVGSGSSNKTVLVHPINFIE